MDEMTQPNERHTASVAFRLRLWWQDFLCLRLGIHKPGIRYEDAYGSHGDDCVRCGTGPL